MLRTDNGVFSNKLNQGFTSLNNSKAEECLKEKKV